MAQLAHIIIFIAALFYSTFAAENDGGNRRRSRGTQSFGSPTAHASQSSFPHVSHDLSVTNNNDANQQLLASRPLTTRTTHHSSLSLSSLTQRPPFRPAQPGPNVDPFHLPPVPSWIRFGPQRDNRIQECEENKRAVQNSRSKLDLVMYGDSITAFHQHYPQAWQKIMIGMDALALGMGGSIIPELAWRIMKGGELPLIEPRNIVLLIGINDLKHAHTPVQQIASQITDLMKWLREVFPSCRLVLLALVPNAAVDVDPVNKQYQQLVKNIDNSIYADCGAGLDPLDKTLYADGTHPTTLAYERTILPCVRQAVGF
jgi:hypothetical protein